MKKLIVMIPAYNEEEKIAGVIKSIPRNIDNIGQVLILVADDGSKDDTVNVSKKAGADFVSSNKQNLGLGKNFQAAIEKSLSLGADIIVNIDGDGQFDAQDIKRLIKPILNNDAEMVTATRFSDKENAKRVPAIKRFGNYAFTKLINLITQQKFTDTQCGFRAYSKKAALSLNLFGTYTYTQETFINLVENEMPIQEVPIKVKYFEGRKSHISGNLINYGFRSLGIIVNSTRDMKPLEFFGVPGLLFFIIGVAGGLYSFVYWAIHLATSPIKTLLLISIFFTLFGLLFIIFGLLADMIKRVKITQEKILLHIKKESLKNKIDEND